MMHVKSLQKYAVLASIIATSCIYAQPLGLIGGTDSNNNAYAAFVDSNGIATPLTSLTSGSGSGITQVAINASDNGIIGGYDSINNPYFAMVSSSGTAQQVTIGLVGGGHNSLGVAINASGQGLIGVTQFNLGFDYGFAYFVSPLPAGTATTISTTLSMSSTIVSVAINDAGLGIIGGTSASNVPYAAIVSSPNIATPITGLSGGQILGVAINNAGQGLIGGNDVFFNAYAAIILPSTTTAIPIPLSVTGGQINSVALNSSSEGIIGGQDSTGAYAAFVSSGGTAMAINTGIITGGSINSVAINDSGTGLIGGQDTSNHAYAAFVPPSGSAAIINIPGIIGNGQINSVAINNFGQGIIASNSYVAIVSPSGTLTPINFGSTSIFQINSVAISAGSILPLLSNIPTGSLSGNNLSFANYINTNAPQDAFYFVPSEFDGTLKQALESAAPTRNAISLYTSSNNLFYLMTSLSNHLHNHPIHRRTAQRATQKSLATVSSRKAKLQSEDQLLASMSLQRPKLAGQSSLAAIASDKERQSEDQLVTFMSPRKLQCQVETICVPEPECPEEGKKNSIWFEEFGALAYQNPQDQTPGFNPSTGGAILAYDGKTSEHSRVGVGATYLFTHIHEDQKAGHSKINQEDLFVYASWENRQFYVDGSILGGLFQISQVRKIHMTGFDFKSTSKPHGWQLLPHLELGYHYSMLNCCQDFEVTVNPFVMLDWANAWQNSYKEKGSGPFNAGQKAHHASLLRTEASLRVYETLFFNSWNLTFQEKVGYVNVHSFGMGKVNAFLVGSPGAFTVETLTSAQNLGVGEFAIIIAPNNSSSPTGTIFYQGEFGVGYQSHQVALELAWNF